MAEADPLAQIGFQFWLRRGTPVDSRRHPAPAFQRRPPRGKHGKPSR